VQSLESTRANFTAAMSPATLDRGLPLYGLQFGQFGVSHCVGSPGNRDAPGSHILAVFMSFFCSSTH
jgi:hypothetical protein